jgi:hypothetical protein
VAPVIETTCKSCGAAIFFVLTRERRWMPVDVKRATVMVPTGREAVQDRVAYPVCDVVKGWVPHFVTCPNAAEHRRRP